MQQCMLFQVQIILAIPKRSPPKLRYLNFDAIPTKEAHWIQGHPLLLVLKKLMGGQEISKMQSLQPIGSILN